MSDELNDLLVSRLRAIADFIEAHPEVPVHSARACSYEAVDADLMFRGCKPEEERRNLTAFARAVGHIDHRQHIGGYYIVKCKIGNVPVSVQVVREAVCRRVVTEQVLPAEPEVTIPAKPARTVQVEKWECDEPVTDNRDSLDSKLTIAPVQQGLERDIVGSVSDDACGDTYLSTQREGGV